MSCPAHRGHQVPWFLTFPAVARKRCPFAHCHSSFWVPPRYARETQRPPRSRAISRITSRPSGTAWPHTGHQCPCLTVVPVASQQCPLPHSHLIRCGPGSDSLERQRPPREVAIATSSPRRRRPLPWQRPHHLPDFTLAGVASQTCPFPHRHVSFVPEFSYVTVRYTPPRARASVRIASMPSLRRVQTHWRHQFPLRISVAAASQRWPAAHSNSARAPTSSVSDKQRPPRSQAMSLISASVTRLGLRRQTLHHDPARTARPDFQKT